MRNSKLYNQKGQSLLEIIVALAIFALVGSLMAPFIVKSFVGLERGGEQTQAEALAQEGIEAVRSIRDNAWNEIFYNQSATVVGSGKWTLNGEGTTEEIGQFTRVITFDNVCRDTLHEIVSCPGNYTDVHSKKITVTVDWEPMIGVTNFVQQTTYLTNWDSQEWIQADWSGGSGQSIWSNQTRYLTDDNNLNVSTIGEVKLKVLGTTQHGSSFMLDSVFGAGIMSKNNYLTSLRFEAQNSKTVDAIRVYLEHEKTSPTYMYGLQADNNGDPSGTWLGNNNQAYGSYQATGAGWQIINLEEQADIIAGTTYHLVVRYQPPYKVGGQNAIELGRSDPNNFMHPYDSSSDLSSNVLWSEDGGISWTEKGYQPIYVLDFLDDTHEGNPYHEIDVRDVYSTFYIGEQFTVVGTDKVLSEISFLVSENNQGPEDDLYVTVYDVTNSEQIERGTIATDADTVNTEYTWVTYSIPSSITLIAGNTYRVYLSSPLSSIQQHYQVRSIYHDDIADLNEINYDGTNAYFVTSNDGGYTWDTNNPNHDINGFYFSKTLYETSGELISSAFNMGTPSKSQIIEWEENIPSCSPACEIKTQIQTAPDNSGSPGEWSDWCGFEGEDGDEVDYFTNSSGELIHTDNNGDQWIRYRVILTGDSLDTPILEEVKINYK